MPLLLAGTIAACGNAVAPAPGEADTLAVDQAASVPAVQQPRKQYVEGRDYVVLERLRVMDPSGFAQPMEAYSILVPKGWKSQGGITWQVGDPCMTEAIHNRVSVTSPDGTMALELYPAQQWEWWDDQMMLQAQMQQQQNPVFRRCPIAQPMDAAHFLQGPMATEMGAQVVSVEPNTEVEAVMRQQAMAANRQYRQAGVNLENRPSAAIGTLRFPDGSGGVAICGINILVSWMPNYMTGGQSASYTCTTAQKLAVRCPAGKEAEARKLLSTVMASFRINPEWQAGVQRMVNNVAAVEQRETAKRAAIQRDAANYAADLQQRSWEERQASQDRVAEGWSQALRGVETWSDGHGGSIELNAGYNEAWSRPDGSYILSNDPNFDPNVAFRENWEKLEKK
jgi:hypothetical protein